MRFRLRTLLIILAIGPIVVVLLLPPYFGGGDGWQRASATAYGVLNLSLLCEGLNERGFDFESVENVRQLLDACAAASEYRYAEFESDWLVKTPYGSEYQYRFIRTSSGCFVEIFAEVPDNVPKRIKDKVRKRIEVRCEAKPANPQSSPSCSVSRSAMCCG